MTKTEFKQMWSFCRLVNRNGGDFARNYDNFFNNPHRKKFFIDSQRVKNIFYQRELIKPRPQNLILTMQQNKIQPLYLLVNTNKKERLYKTAVAIAESFHKHNTKSIKEIIS